MPLHKILNRISIVAIYVLVIAGAIGFVLPLLWMIRTSLMPLWQMDIFPPQWWPQTFNWQSYLQPWIELPFDVFYLNSSIIAALTILGILFSGSITAYAFARLQFPGRNVLFVILLSTMMLPSQITLIPKYFLFSKMGWIDTLKPLIVPHWFAVDAFYIFLMRQFFMNIPRDLEEAARIDGAGFLKTYWYIILPLSRPVLAICAMLIFTFTWSDFFDPLIYLNSQDHYTVPLGLTSYQERSYEGPSNIGKLMAMSLVSLLPVLILFFFGQRYFIKGISMQGVNR